MKTEFLKISCLSAISWLFVSCASSDSLFQHGVWTMPASKKGGDRLFIKGLSGRESDALIVLMDKNFASNARGTIKVKSGDVRFSFLFPNDFTECSSWLGEKSSEKRAFLVRIGDKGLIASEGKPLRIEEIGFKNDIDIYLWRLPGWYLKR